jgi:NADH:ubiquinone reductase (H+-translocating)
MIGGHRVVIIGGGFGGLSAVLKLARAGADVTLIDRRNYHVFQPLLYQVATGALSPANIASPLRNILNRYRNAAVLLAEATAIDAKNRRVILRDGALEYDTLIVATGSSHQYFGHDDWERFAPGLKTIEDATNIRRRILLAFEAAERETDPEKRRAWLTFVIVGAGPTGVELAGALGEIAHDTLRHDFRSIDPSSAHISLVEATGSILPFYPHKLSAAAQRMLEHLHVTVRTNAMVTQVNECCVMIRESGQETAIPTRTILWAAGVLASPLTRSLADATGASLDKQGRMIVERDLTIPGHPEIFAIGDLANFSYQTGQPLPGVAQPAIQQGAYAARTIIRRLKGKNGSRPFHYFDKGNLATIGRGRAVCDVRGLPISGWPAWLIWLFIHLIYIIQFRNRLLVLVQWGYTYLTHDRSARLITGKDPFPLDL